MRQYIPDVIMFCFCAFVFAQGMALSRRMEKLQSLESSVVSLASDVYSFARRVDFLEQAEPVQVSSSVSSVDYEKTIGVLDARYCKAFGKSGVVLNGSTIFVGDDSAYGILLSCGPSWARFTSGSYLLKPSSGV